MGDDFQLLLGLIPRLRFLIGEPVQEALWSGKVIRARTGGGGSECFEPLTTLLGELTIFGVPVNSMHLE